MKKISIDVMTEYGERFYRNLKYEYNPVFKFDFKAMMDFVYQKLPTLRYRNDVVLYIDN